MSVYFIRVGGYFKIGASKDPERRCLNLHQGSSRYTFPPGISLAADDRELYKFVEGWKDVEYCVHMALDNFSVGLEWFLDEPAVREFIDGLSIDLDMYLDSGGELTPVERPGGWCADEYRRVQQGRAEHEMARFQRRRAA